MAPSLALLCLTLLSASPIPRAGDGEAGASLQGTVPEGRCVVLPDEPVDPSVTAEWNGRTVAFCCKMCRKKFLADPESFAPLLPPLARQSRPGRRPLTGRLHRRRASRSTGRRAGSPGSDACIR
jgi:hypothetical protein